MSIASRKSCTPIESSGPTWMTPALLIRTSMRRKRSTAWPTKEAACSGSLTSQVMARTPGSRTANSARARSNSAGSRAQIATRAPLRDSSRAITSPSPREPPVTRTTLPANENDGKARLSATKAPAAPAAQNQPRPIRIFRTSGRKVGIPPTPATRSPCLLARPPVDEFAGLLEPEGFDGIEPGGAERRIETRDDASQAGGEHGSEHHRRGKQRRPIALRGHPLRDSDPERKPDRAAHAGKHHRLGEELEGAG